MGVLLHEIAHAAGLNHATRYPPYPPDYRAQLARVLDEVFQRSGLADTGVYKDQYYRRMMEGGLPPDGSPKEGAYAGDAKDRFGAAEEKQSPLVLDLDGDGLDLLALADSNAFFDLDNDGFVEKVGWVSADDGLLARDLDGNGFIEGRAELFGGSLTCPASVVRVEC